ncbi:uncharacterized protein DS421_1g32980 [Arachis hypogaea]|nr:uncharacterized protein DS421_1g32980 [Arachis hypogaea]
MTTSHHPSTISPETGTSRANAAKGEKPTTEEKSSLSPPPRSSSRPQGCSAASSRAIKGNRRLFLKSVKEPSNPNLVGFKSNFSNLLKSHFDPFRLSSRMNFEFHRAIVSNHPLCSTYVADLKALTKKEINFVDNIIYLD